ncbi:SseB family protein [Alphaproteobacteria bacterium KMM 3653]|uniref:SseB family protein n=1 Tax=Harenicola maris TaxID=2841044 RepID=A0AAP2G974_9RHOB|nr:SseB family protein [Harenicola maris]
MSQAETSLETAHMQMEAEGSEAARRAYLTRLAQAELFLWITSEEAPEPRVLETEEGRLALAFDTEARLASLSEGAPVPYATLSGRAAARMLRGSGLGLGVNLTGVGGAFVLDAEGVDWLAVASDARPEVEQGALGALSAPEEIAPELLEAVDRALSSSAGWAQTAHLVGRDGGALLLVVAGAGPEGEAALGAALAEALAIAGLEADGLTLAFVEAGAPVLLRLADIAIRFDLPAAPVAEMPGAPGRDPAKPPRIT